MVLLLTGDWFTDNVPENTSRDLLFQDMICLQLEGRIKSYIIFTSLEGRIYITLMGTHPEYRDQGL
ncbi:MAG: hypothetical protein K0Q73_4319 [Paenibacillus sp.]|nr:hypothetical protein [Paenibacillus sp.]